MKKSVIFISLLILMVLFISACKSNTSTQVNQQEEDQTFDSAEDFCPQLPGIPLGACPETNGNVQWTYDEQGCIVGYECGAAPTFDATALDTCLARCEEPDIKAANEPEIKDIMVAMPNYRECQMSCYNQKAGSTKNPQECNTMLEWARQNPNPFFARYFICMISSAEQSDPSLCDVAQGDKINYPYCINKIAIKTKDAAVCNLVRDLDQNNFYYNNCVKAIQRGY